MSGLATMDLYQCWKTYIFIIELFLLIKTEWVFEILKLILLSKPNKKSIIDKSILQKELYILYVSIMH